MDVPKAIYWNMPPEGLNPVLRALWKHVELGPDLHPAAAERHFPEWGA